MSFFTAEQIARVCHEANRGLTALTLDVPVQPSWDDATEEQRSSCIDGVRHAIENPGTTPGALHENWMKGKLKQGWKFGPVKDETLKTHPALVSYDQLKPSAKLKDELFRAVVQVLR